MSHSQQAYDYWQDQPGNNSIRRTPSKIISKDLRITSNKFPNGNLKQPEDSLSKTSSKHLFASLEAS
ncbi:hypothetical protein PCANB_000880 [Pneumocystis canis]|nr:hypothetical protein PCANB_000880 [Pneumocystis canis]